MVNKFVYSPAQLEAIEAALQENPFGAEKRNHGGDAAKVDCQFILARIEMKAADYVAGFKKAERLAASSAEIIKHRKTLSALVSALSHIERYPVLSPKEERYYQMMVLQGETPMRAAIRLFNIDKLDSIRVKELGAIEKLQEEIALLRDHIAGLMTVSTLRIEARNELIVSLAGLWVGYHKKMPLRGKEGPFMRYLIAAAFPAMRAARDFSKKGRRRRSGDDHLSPISEESLLAIIGKAKERLERSLKRVDEENDI